MRKKTLVTILLCLVAMTAFVGCGTSNDSKKEASKETTKETSKNSDKQEDGDKEEKEDEKVYNIGETAELRDWGIVVSDMQIVPSIDENYVTFKPDQEGAQFAKVSVNVTNNGKTSDTFLPSYEMGDDVNAKILFGDGYEFSATILLGYSADMHDSTINPLSSKEGDIAFEVPDTVINSTDPLIVQFNSGSENVKIKIR